MSAREIAQIKSALERAATQRSTHHARPRRRRASLAITIAIGAASLAATAAIAGISPWPAGSSMHSDHGTPILSLQDDTSHPYNAASAADTARINQARAALADAPTAPAFTPRIYTPPASASETAYGTCTQVQDSLIACGSNQHHFYLVRNQTDIWVPVGNCVSTSTIEGCAYPYDLAIDFTTPASPVLTRVQ